MKEIRDIIHSFKEAIKAGKRTALATVVRVEGSSYRRPGARMLVTEDGQLTGAISGGCLEGDALRKALLAIHQQQNKLVTYDTRDEDAAELGVQLGCNGVVHILFEPIVPEQSGNPMELLERLLEERRYAALAVVFSIDDPVGRHPGTCFLHLGNIFFQGGDPDGMPGGGTFKKELCHDAREALAKERSISTVYRIGGKGIGGKGAVKTGVGDDQVCAFIEFLKPPVSLVIIGAGNDTLPLAEMAGIQGWDITVVDGRANYAHTRRFPGARKIIVTKAEQVVSQLSIDRQTAVLLMTHNYNYDLAVFRQLVWSDCPYIGSLGPRKKLERMLEDLREEGMEISEAQRYRIFGPMGLDMGSETAEEIALSILAEIKMVFEGRSGHSLRERKTAIHDVFLHLDDQT